LFSKHMCWDACESVAHTEWSIDFVSSEFNPQYDTTTFVWKVSTSSVLPSPTCNAYDASPAPLTDVTVRMGCDCEPQSDTFLRSITDHMVPSGIAESNFWRFDNLDVKAGESKELTVVLKGDISMKWNGDATLGGDHRCVSTLTSDVSIQVPNPCSNKCNFGEWTDWQLQGLCSVECGGGEQVRTRTCVSICDQSVFLDNCPGEAHGTIPCNTHTCPVWISGSSSSSSSDSSSSSSSDSSSSSSGSRDSDSHIPRHDGWWHN